MTNSMLKTKFLAICATLSHFESLTFDAKHVLDISFAYILALGLETFLGVRIMTLFGLSHLWGFRHFFIFSNC